jgi:hypothetical protein
MAKPKIVNETEFSNFDFRYTPFEKFEKKSLCRVDRLGCKGLLGTSESYFVEELVK